MTSGRSTTQRSAGAYRARPWVFLALAAVAALGVYLHFVSNGPLPFDEAWRSFVRLAPGSFGFAVARFMAAAGSTVGVATCAAIAAAFLFANREKRAGWAIVVTCALGIAVNQLAKFLVDRPRPMDPLFEASGTSFPSGHSMGAAALSVSLAFAVAALARRPDAWVTTATVRWAGVLAAVWILTMMWSRTALGVHWLSDTIAGATVGIAAAFFGQWICGQPRPSVSAPA